MPAGEISTSDIANLTITNQRIKRFDRFLQQRVAIPFMKLLEVDRVRLHGPQACFVCGDQVLA